jgi:hypothetical protein
MADIIKLKDLPKRRIAKNISPSGTVLYFARDGQNQTKCLWIWPNSGGSFEFREYCNGTVGDWDVELLPTTTTVTLLFDGSGS